MSDPAPEPDRGDACRNCDGELLSARYCPDCGQLHRPGPLRLGELGHEVLATLTDFEHGFVNTFKGLTVAPGQMVREYVDGRRRSHAGPIRYYFAG